MTTIYETAAALMTADQIVTGHVEARAVAGLHVHGYLLMNGRRVLALIETLKPDARIVGHLKRLTAAKRLKAREVMRQLLGAEDYMSTMYDNIVRVHYAEEWEIAKFGGLPGIDGVPGNKSSLHNLPRPVGKCPELAAGYTPNWRQDAYETFDGKRYQK